jgi:hypothetical protein
MAFLDWIKRRKQGAELKALGRKYGHSTIGAPGASIRHYEKLMELQKQPGKEAQCDNLKTQARPRPSWER